jgi:hypothetical protein
LPKGIERSFCPRSISPRFRVDSDDAGRLRNTKRREVQQLFRRQVLLLADTLVAVVVVMKAIDVIVVKFHPNHLNSSPLAMQPVTEMAVELVAQPSIVVIVNMSIGGGRAPRQRPLMLYVFV